VRVPVPQPGADQVLIRVAASSLNPLEYKLADLNFFGRTPPVVLGLDLSGIVVAIGSAVHGIAVGDSVVAMADLNGDGGRNETGQPHNQVSQILVTSCVPGYERATQKETFRDVA
jgi:NADPH:quinone reductase-like Zn-dependent oxidoreductase